ncbi:ubiquitin carboxyl-terminal hydrolase 42-like isoform X5 [Neopelma chrysocephalum]|uniref:ubiquitin carboxyl-terminal hydrolase 42-like isoform X5 n=1 Tax=Neopelma chrysocephalum TaxID=114329 RepID=UPI000FCCFE1D|nr:ubiquitin carboxyl-terminal hydrolase 42-like isoform X5 [Neopelma chrysocephalum]
MSMKHWIPSEGANGCLGHSGWLRPTTALAAQGNGISADLIFLEGGSDIPCYPEFFHLVVRGATLTTGNKSFIAKGMTPTQRIPFPSEEICMDWQQRQRPGPGLRNLGSTCYINVILQCLTYTPPLANYLLSREHSQLCSQEGFCMMCTMEAHVRKVLRSSASAIWPKAVIRDLKLIGEEFEPDTAGDAFEFLCCALKAMQRACLSGCSNLDISSQTSTIVHQIFGGLLKSRVTCLRCKAVSDSYKAFLHILLDIKEASSLTAALEDFVTPKQLGGGNCFKCSKCEKKEVTISKRVTVHHVPKVFTVCLERAADHTGKKISTFVEYPEYLDLLPYMSDIAGEPLLYSLYAVVVHSGDTCLDGHFFCYTKASNGLWYKMDDESVDNCGIHAVLRQQAYLLFYVRCSDLKMREMAASSLTPPHAHSLLSECEGSSKQAGSAGPQALPDRTTRTCCQRKSATEKAQSRSLHWGNDRCSWFVSSTDYDNSTGRKRKRIGPPGRDRAPQDGTASEPSKRSCQRAPAPSAAQEQPLQRRREQRRSLRQGYNLRRRFVEITDYHQSAKKRRKHSSGINRQKSQSQD